MPARIKNKTSLFIYEETNAIRSGHLTGLLQSAMPACTPSGNVTLISVGTDGDVYPFIGLGIKLRARGHRVRLATHEHFAKCAKAGGLEFCPLVSNAETDELLGQPDFWHPLKGAVVVARWGARFIERQYEVLAEFGSQDGALFIASPGVVAARVVQEKMGLPMVSVVLQPWLIPSVYAPPVLMGGMTLPRWAPRFVHAGHHRLIDGVGALLVGNRLNRLRLSLGLKPMRRMFRWWLSPQLVLGLFPDWYARPQPDWPVQIKLTGFPLEDGRPGSDLPREVREFCRSGKPPVAFTFGTGMMHAADLFQSAIEACRTIGQRAILLTRFRSQLPDKLPRFAHHCEFAPFDKLFPKCAAVVHHGGIGTVSKALASGTPQLIVPFAFDQLDNALRVKELGGGSWLPANQRHPRGMAHALKNLLAHRTAQQTHAMTSRFTGRNGLDTAVDAIEDFWLTQSEAAARKKTA